MTNASRISAPGDGGGAAEPGRRGQMALALQEMFTATVRLRANRQVAADAESFRAQIKHVLATAGQEARRAGYVEDDVRLALYAAVAFLDESVLNSAQPMFAQWPRKPLQDELFGDHNGGETFFRYLQQLLARQDADDLADLIEVYQLCLLLGFRGRYGAVDGGELQTLSARASDKIARIRGPHGELSPAWAPSARAVTASAPDAWVRRLCYGALAAAALACALFLAFHLSLRAGVADLQALPALAGR